MGVTLINPAISIICNFYQSGTKFSMEKSSIIVIFTNIISTSASMSNVDCSSWKSYNENIICLCVRLITIQGCKLCLDSFCCFRSKMYAFSYSCLASDLFIVYHMCMKYLIMKESNLCVTFWSSIPLNYRKGSYGRYYFLMHLLILQFFKYLCSELSMGH